MLRLAAIGAVLLVLAGIARTIADPTVRFFASSPEAPWIRVDRDFTPQPFGDASLTSEFQLHFNVNQPARDVTLQVTAPFKARVGLDGAVLEKWTANQGDWKTPRTIRLGDLSPGPHELAVVAENERGPNAIKVTCDSLPLSTTARWEGKELDSGFKPVVTVDERRLSDAASQFPSAAAAFQTVWPWAALLGTCGAVFGIWLGRRRQTAEVSIAAGEWTSKLPGWIRIAALATFCGVAINNLCHGWIGDGFDYEGHIDYVRFLLQKGALPSPRDGIQMFQSPLYYFLGAAFVTALSPVTSPERAMQWLVLINLACGAVLIEICWQTMKLVFRDRPVAQSLGMLIGGFLPMNFYFSNYVGNQALEGALTALALMLTVKYLAAEQWATGKQLSLLSAVLGLALLAKVNAVVPAALIVAVLFVRSVIEQRSTWMTCEDLLFLCGPMLAIAGWYYFRNWLSFGKPFIGGWEAEAAFRWWQDRGFNTPRDLYTLGPGITHPIYAALGSVWDGFYSSMWLDSHLGGAAVGARPRWNESFLISSALVGLVPTAGMLLGLAVPFVRKKEASATLFSAVTIIALAGTYVAFNLRSPCFAAAKAFYVIGGLPLLAVLAGLGLEVFIRSRWTRPLVIACLACLPVWTAASYLILK